MDFDELYNLIRASIYQMWENGQKPSKVVIAGRYEDMCRRHHAEIASTTVIKTIYGIPLEFVGLPGHLIFYIESEVEE